jgi:hypothetical protein
VHEFQIAREPSHAPALRRQSSDAADRRRAGRPGREIRPQLSESAGAQACFESASETACGTEKNPLVAIMATSGGVAGLFDQAALDLATWVAIASINAGDRQS